jgi:hypothetical protein
MTGLEHEGDASAVGSDLSHGASAHMVVKQAIGLGSKQTG